MYVGLWFDSIFTDLKSKQCDLFSINILILCSTYVLNMKKLINFYSLPPYKDEMFYKPPSSLCNLFCFNWNWLVLDSSIFFKTNENMPFCLVVCVCAVSVRVCVYIQFFFHLQWMDLNCSFLGVSTRTHCAPEFLSKFTIPTPS